MTVMARLAKAAVWRRLDRLRHGRVSLVDGGVERQFGAGTGSGATVHVRDPRFYRAVALGGHIGAAEAFARGWWTTEDLTGVVRTFIRNRDALEGLEAGLARLVQPIRSLTHWLRRNSKHGSRRNITAHYDLGNEFFALFLDETMTYSSAFFERPTSTLAEASLAKYDRICRKLGLRHGHRVLDIGCGWGGFAVHAAQRHGCRVTAITLSPEQERFARERVSAARLGDRVRVLRQDYRDVQGRFDRIASIEMIEAVGHQYYAMYFDRIAALLEPDGLAVIQAITIQDRYYEQARREVDFIKQYIFPGSCIPSVAALAAAWTPTDLRLVHAEDFGPHYARTLAEWSRRFETQSSALAALEFDAWFQRLWRFYFAYCEGGFAERVLGVSQLVLAKPAASLTARAA